MVDKAATVGERVFVGARNGRVLARFNLVHNLAEGQELAPLENVGVGVANVAANVCGVQ